MRVLLVNGNMNSAKAVSSELSSFYVVDLAYSGDEGVCLSQVNEYDALVIDSCPPDVHGGEVCLEVRKAEVSTPILLLDKKTCTEDELVLLENGADMILPKPFRVDELFRYLHIMIKRSHGAKYKNEIKVGEFTLDLDSREVRWKNELINLTKKEFTLLELLMLNKNLVLTKEKLLEHSWEAGLDIGSNTLEVHVKSLRDKLDRKYNTELIKTVYGFGYKLCAKV